MSKIIRKDDWRELAHYVELDNGKQFYVDSCYVWGIGFETICRELNEKGVPFPGGQMGRVRYHSYEEMVAGHKDICEHLEDWVR